MTTTPYDEYIKTVGDDYEKKMTAADFDFAKFMYDAYHALHEQSQRLTDIIEAKEDPREYFNKTYMPARYSYMKKLFEYFRKFGHCEIETAKHQEELLVVGLDRDYECPDISWPVIDNLYEFHEREYADICETFTGWGFFITIDDTDGRSRGIELEEWSTYEDYDPDALLPDFERAFKDIADEFNEANKTKSEIIAELEKDVQNAMKRLEDAKREN